MSEKLIDMLSMQSREIMRKQKHFKREESAVAFVSGLADSLVNNTIYQIEIIKEEYSQGFY